MQPSGAIWSPLLTLIAITIHRVILLGTDSVPIWGIRPSSPWSYRESHFLLYLLLFSAIDYFIAWVFFTGLVFIAFGLLVIKLYFLVRMSLIFPSIAADKPISLLKSWQLTANYQGYMLTITLVPLFVLNIWIFLWKANLWKININGLNISGDVVGLAVGPVIGVNIHLPKVATFSVAAGHLRGRYIGDYNGTGGSSIDLDFDVDSTFVNFSVLFRIRSEEHTSELQSH